MWTRTAKIINLDVDNYEKLIHYVHELQTHSMYKYIVEDLKKRPGFIKKEHIICEDINGQTYFNRIVFDTEQNLRTYIQEEAIRDIWTYIELSSKQRNFSFEMQDTEF